MTKIKEYDPSYWGLASNSTASQDAGHVKDAIVVVPCMWEKGAGGNMSGYN
jgi:hypothetical protein